MTGLHLLAWMVMFGTVLAVFWPYWVQHPENEFVEHWLHDDGPCPACAATWVDRERVHDDDCAYVAWMAEEES
jgi:hypothetical protein